MTEPTRGRSQRLTDLVAEEVRAIMGRRRKTGAALARQLGVSQMWVSDRLRGVQPFDLGDLERIAGVLEVEVADLLPRSVRQSMHDNHRYPSRADRPSDNRPAGGPRTGEAPRVGHRRSRHLIHPSAVPIEPEAA